jgi:predicted O-linked N-acetylglucosamine transferase (SPINDLY family)
LLDATDDASDHMACYGWMDVALDPFPYGGATTSCEALVMGVPVVTLAGAGMVGRLSSSILSSAGLADWIALNEEEYVAIAVALAADGVRRKKKRLKLRQRVLQSPLCDGQRLCTELEQVYRDACAVSAVE